MEMEFFSLKSMVLLGGFTLIAIGAFLVGVIFGKKIERDKNS